MPNTKTASDAIALIGIDWGSSHVRVLALGGDGAVLHTSHHEFGLKAMAGRSFPEATAALISPLNAPHAPILICGMAGARGGWVEVPYAPAPITVEAIAAHQIELAVAQKGQILAQHRVFIAGGLSINIGSRFDVMRGEETQILGYLSQANPSLKTLILPGTHSKWAKISGHHVTEFTTFFTGDLFASLKDHPILIGATTQIDNDDAFVAGVDASDDLSLLTTLFTARTKVLSSALDPAHTRSYLSGLLIGTELRHACLMGYEGPFALLGSDALNRLYTQAALALRMTAPWCGDTDTLTAAGLFARFLSIRG